MNPERAPLRSLPRDEFPALLREIPDPPERLYVRGTLPASPDDRFLCIVGSRKHTSYGKNACEKIVSELRPYGNIVVVSGLALGIDSIAHRAALAVGLRTVAIPGSGLHDRVLYPRSNLGLAHRILKQGGALLSEYDLEFAATKWSFPKRNRLMAGMAHAVLLIEAAERSGTLITARLALDYNRELLAVPGSIFSANAAGANRLIAEGAIPVRSGDDVREALRIPQTATSISSAEDSCTPEERRILEFLIEPLEQDEIAIRLDIPARKVNEILIALELKGLLVLESGVARRT